jgi:hypothetical protein
MVQSVHGADLQVCKCVQVCACVFARPHMFVCVCFKGTVAINYNGPRGAYFLNGWNM